MNSDLLLLITFVLLLSVITLQYISLTSAIDSSRVNNLRKVSSVSLVYAVYIILLNMTFTSGNLLLIIAPLVVLSIIKLRKGESYEK